MANFRMLLINLLLVSLFVLALLIGGYTMAVQNGREVSILDVGNLSTLKENLADSLADSYTDSKGASASFQNSSISLTSGIPFIDSIYKTWKVLKTTPELMYNFINSAIFENILGNNAMQIILAVIGTIFIITLIFAVVKLISTGDGG